MKIINREDMPAVCIALLLFIIPFFWLKPGEMDLGGDNSRLYLYDPQSYLRAAGMYSVDPQGTQKIMPNQNLFPLLSILVLIRNLSGSPDLPGILEKSFKLSGSFWFIYLIVKELLTHFIKRKYLLQLTVAAVLAGLVYLFSPAVVENMRYALLTHNQVFLNAILFYLLLRYFKTDRSVYLFIIIIVTVVFAPNFTLVGPPPFFAFYPLASLFLFFYIKFVLGKSILRKPLFFTSLLGLGIHAYHFIPEFSYLLNPGSELSQRIFEATIKTNPGIEYFNAVFGLAKVSNNLLFISPSLPGIWTMIVMPLTLLGGFLLVRGTGLKKTFLLVSAFYLVTLFLMSANITSSGVNLYRLLYYIPGFGMFRNFFGQFQFVYAFFYSVLFGIASGIIFVRLKPKYFVLISVLILLLLTYRSWPFLTGKFINSLKLYTTNVSSIVKMDPRYEETLNFIRSLPSNGKTLTVPLSDSHLQVVYGANNGAYMGPSTVSYLTGRGDFLAYHYLAPFSEALLRLYREKKYEDIRFILSVLNIRYILHNSDPRVYDDSFKEYPYSFMRTTLPKTQKGYADFVSRLGYKQIYENGPYKIYMVKDSDFIPLLSIPRAIQIYQDDRKTWDTVNKSFFATGKDIDRDNAFILDSDCSKYLADIYCKDSKYTFADRMDLKYSKVNPTKYKIIIDGSRVPFILIFSTLYNSSWKIYISKDIRNQQGRVARVISTITQKIFNDPYIFQTLGLSEISNTRHFIANGYANAWILIPGEFGSGEHELILETSEQRVFYLSSIVSLIIFPLLLVWGVFLLKNKH